MPHAPLHREAHRLRRTLTPWLRSQLVELQRDPRRQRLVSFALATIAALIVGLALLNLQHASDALGARTNAYLTTRELRPGDTITATAIRRAEHPTAFLPPTALPDSPIGKSVRQHVMPGELLTSTNVHISSDDHVPRGWRVVAITARSTLPPLEAGSRADVIARAEVVVTGAIVVSVSDAGRSAMIAIPAEFAAIVATEAALGEATLAASG